MKWILLAILLPISIADAQEVRVSGIYKGRDLYVHNPYIKKSKSFCITNISVNGNGLGTPKTSAYKIDLSGYALNQILEVVITHSNGCFPSIINAQVIGEEQHFEFVSLRADNNSVSWITGGELRNGVFMLQRMKREEWKTIAQYPGKGNLETNQYSVNSNHYAGENEYRLIFFLDGNEELSSESFYFNSNLNSVTFFPEKNVEDVIHLSRFTDYIILDLDNNVLMQGEGDEIDVKALSAGEYGIVLEQDLLYFTKSL